MSLQKLNKKGFTIIELLIVIVVIGILAALVLTAYGNIQARARDTERRNDISEIHKQLELFYTDDERGNGAYPVTADLATEITQLNAEILEDPNGVTINDAGSNYTYTSADGSNYTLQTTLESTPSTPFSRPSLN